MSTQGCVRVCSSCQTNPAWGRSTRTQLSPSRCHVLIVIVPVSLWPTDSEERTLSLLRPRRMIGQSRSPTPWTSLEFLDPSAGQELEDSCPAWPGCGTRGPSFRHHGSAVDRRDPSGTAGDHRKGSRLERSPRSPGSGELSCRWQECFSRVQTVRSDPVWPRFPAIRKCQEGGAAAPRSLKAPVSSYVPFTKRLTDVGFRPRFPWSRT